MRHSTIRQKSLILAVFIRLCQDPQALVEIYINYDCDRAAPENIYEKLMNIVSKIGQTHFAPPSKEELKQGEGKSAKEGMGGPNIPPSLTTAAMGEKEHASYAGLSPEIKLRRQSLECLVNALKSLATWATANSGSAATGTKGDADPRASEDTARPLAHRNGTAASDNFDLAAPSPIWPGANSGSATPGGPGASSTGVNTPDPDDDVARLEGQKQRKTTLQEGIKKFNFKPKRGIEFLVENGFIRSKAPTDIARFLLQNEGLSKAMIGEYLGEG